MEKKYSSFVMPDDIDNSFDETDYILNYKPQIEFVEPPQEQFDYGVIETPVIDDIKNRVSNLSDTLTAVSKLIDQTQKRVDQKVAVLGGVDVKLDPLQDMATIAAMKRRFPDKVDPTIISYDEYKQVIDCINNSAQPTPVITEQDLVNASKEDPYKTDFGGSNNNKGENRPEIASLMNTVSPIDLSQFQKMAVIALYALLLPMVKTDILSGITKHKLDTPHT